jgi:CelD/BcsL family acetyltransferase involved in cellulose biosynthesis
MLQGSIVQDPADIETLVPRWDALAVDLDRPYGLPSWLLAWQRHVAPPGSHTLIVAVNDDEDLLGLFPLTSYPGPGGLLVHRFLASDTSMPVAPLVRPERREETLRAAGETLGSARPEITTLSLRGAEASSDWSELLADAFHGRQPRVYVEDKMPAPVIRIQGREYADLLQSRSSKFRQQMRRSRRRAEEQGAVFRRARDVDAAKDDLRTFARLHLDRWKDRGGSLALRPGVFEMLLDFAEQEIPTGRFRIFSIDLDETTISTQLFVRAGRRTSFWLGAFDPAAPVRNPGLLGVLAGIEDAFGEGLDEIDLGPGDDQYKRSLTDDDVVLRWVTLVAGGKGSFGRRARLLPYRARRAVARRLPEGVRIKLKKLLRRS